MKKTIILFSVLAMLVVSFNLHAEYKYQLRYQSTPLLLNGSKDSTQQYLCERPIINVVNVVGEQPDILSLTVDANPKYLLSANNDSLFFFVNIKDYDLVYNEMPLETSDKVKILFNVKKAGVDSIVSFSFPLLYDQQGVNVFENGSAYFSVMNELQTGCSFDIAIPFASLVNPSELESAELSFEILYVDDDSNDDTENADFMLAAFSNSTFDPLVDASMYRPFLLPIEPHTILAHLNAMRDNVFQNFEEEVQLSAYNPIHKLSQQIIAGDTVLCDTIDKTGGGAFPNTSWNGSKYTALRYYLNSDQILDFTLNPTLEFNIYSDSTFVLATTLTTDWGITSLVKLDTVPEGTWKNIKIDFSTIIPNPDIPAFYKFNRTRGLLFNIFGFDEAFTEDDNKIKTVIYLDDILFGDRANLEPNGLKNPISNNNVVVYPNPSSNYITVQNASKDARISICDLMGREVVSLFNQSDKIDVSSLNNGIYLVRVIEQNKVISTSKFIKTK